MILNTRIQTPKEAPRFCGSFGCLNIKNRWMAIFIERKQFCHQSPSSHACAPPGLLWSPVVPCGLLWCPVLFCAMSLSPVVPFDVLFTFLMLSWFCLYLFLLLCLVFALGVLYAISLCLVARLFTDWFVHCFVCSFIRSFACFFFFCSFVS